MTELRKGLPPVPRRMVGLPIDPRGYPIPWFVAEVDGKRDFRVADGVKRARAAKNRLCWLCGERLGRYMAFVIGPMCAVNRNTSEPGCHKDCALFAVQACPFITRPLAQYRTAGLPEEGGTLPYALEGNPGGVCIWITESFRPYKALDSWLIQLGAPVEVLWWVEGREASRAQVLSIFENRLPLLEKIAKEEGGGAPAALQRQVVGTMQFLPAA